MAASLTRIVHGLHFKNLRGDLFGGLTAAIVALPLALAFGVSSGAGPTAGLYGAICVGFFAALFGGTPSQISGPTGPMTVVMASILTASGSGVEMTPAIAFTIVMLGGLFQIIFGLLRLGKWITLMPYTVISGFMSGIGVIILLLQIGPLLGYPSGGKVVDAVLQIPDVFANINPIAAGLGILTLIIVFAAPPKLNKIIPAPLLALTICTLLSVFVFGDSDIPRIGSIQGGLPQIQIPSFQLGQTRQILTFGLILATLGSIDSLLTSLVADNITHTQHDSNRELIGQGIGNMISGFLGGLPGAGATMRTVINVQSGGKTPLSGILHALILLVVMVQARGLTEPIPNAVLAGILFKVGIDIIDWGFLKRAHKLSPKGAGIMYLVLILTVFVDLITAVAVGVFLANMMTVQNMTALQAEQMKTITRPEEADQLEEEERELLEQARGRVLMFCLSGPMSFGAAKSISQRLSIVENYEVLILDVSQVSRIGVTALLAIENIIKESLNKQRQVLLLGVHGRAKERLKLLEVIRDMPPVNFPMSRSFALKAAMSYLNSDTQPSAKSYLKADTQTSAKPDQVLEIDHTREIDPSHL